MSKVVSVPGTEGAPLFFSEPPVFCSAEEYKDNIKRTEEYKLDSPHAAAVAVHSIDEYCVGSMYFPGGGANESEKHGTMFDSIVPVVDTKCLQELIERNFDAFAASNTDYDKDMNI